MVYDALEALKGAKVTEASEYQIVFDNGLIIECEDVSNFINVSGFKEAK